MYDDTYPGAAPHVSLMEPDIEAETPKRPRRPSRLDLSMSNTRTRNVDKSSFSCADACKNCFHGICLFLVAALKWLPVGFILGTVAFSYFVVLTRVIDFPQCFTHPASDADLAFSITLFTFYNISIALFVWSFLKTLLTPGGSVPEKWKLDESAKNALTDAPSEDAWKMQLERFVSSQGLVVLQRSVQGAIRYCEKCSHIKPDRSHHCSVCDVCVLKMDHHCMWVGNCIGFGNYKFFLQFLFYAYIYVIFLIALLYKPISKLWSGNLVPNENVNSTHSISSSSSSSTNFVIHPDQLSSSGSAEYQISMDDSTSGTATEDNEISVVQMEEVSVDFPTIFISLLSVLFLVFLSSLLWYHAFLAAVNRTTLEQFRSPTLANGEDDPDAWNLGSVFKNYKSVFGNSYCCVYFCLPIGSSPGQGTEFATRNRTASANAMVPILPSADGKPNVGDTGLSLQQQLRQIQDQQDKERKKYSDYLNGDKPSKSESATKDGNSKPSETAIVFDSGTGEASVQRIHPPRPSSAVFRGATMVDETVAKTDTVLVSMNNGNGTLENNHVAKARL